MIIFSQDACAALCYKDKRCDFWTYVKSGDSNEFFGRCSLHTDRFVHLVKREVKANEPGFGKTFFGSKICGKGRYTLTRSL